MDLRQDIPNEQILARGRELLGLIDAASRSGFAHGGWRDWLLNWSMRHEGLKEHMFNFIAILPKVDTPQAFAALLRESFVGHDDVPWLLRAATRTLCMTGPLGMSADPWATPSHAPRVFPGRLKR